MKIGKILEVVGSGIGGVILTLVVQQCFPNQQAINLTINDEDVKITEEDYSELYNRNNELKNELLNTSQELVDTKDELKQTENKLSTIQNNLSTTESKLNGLLNDMPKFEYSDIRTNIDGVNKNDYVKGYLDIDGRQFVLLDVLNEIIDKDINYEDNVLYVGHSTAEKVNLLDVCPPYDFSEGYNTNPFKMNGDQYDGFSMYLNGTKYALINLKNQYSNLEFDFGHIDGAANYNCTLKIYLDEKLVQSIEKRPDSMVSHIEIPLNYSKQLKIEFNYGYSVGQYGLGNIYLQY